MVGEPPARAAWLLAQHADHDTSFQRRCLELLQQVPADQIDRPQVAYLDVRVRLAEGRPQRYGTQFWLDAQGVFGPGPIEEPKGLDDRRREVGLGPFAAYQQRMGALYATWPSLREQP